MDLATHNAARLGMTRADALARGFIDRHGTVLPAHHTTGRTTMSEQIVPVTPNLAAALDRTGLMLRTLEQSDKKMNDADGFKSVANQLEDLTVAVLATTSSLSLIGVTPCGARFNLAPVTDLAKQVTSCVTYLRGPATNLIKANSFSRYESKYVQDVLARTDNLYYLVLGAIRHRAMADLRDVSDRSASVLVALAETIAEAATVAEAADGGRVNTTPQPRGDQYLTPKS